MLFCGPFAQVSSHLTDDLQDAVVGVCGQYRQILALTQINEHTVKARDLRRIGAGAFFLCFGFFANPANLCVIKRELLQDQLYLLVTFGDLVLIVFPALQGLA